MLQNLARKHAEPRAAKSNENLLNLVSKIFFFFGGGGNIVNITILLKQFLEQVLTFRMDSLTVRGVEGGGCLGCIYVIF